MDAMGKIVPWDDQQEHFLEQITYLQHDTLRLPDYLQKEPLVYLCGNQFKRDFDCLDKYRQVDLNRENSSKDREELSVTNIDMDTIVSKMHWAHETLFPMDRVREMIMYLDGTDYSGEYYIPHDSLAISDWNPETGFDSGGRYGYNSLADFEADLKVDGLESFVLHDAMNTTPSELWKKNEEELEQDKNRER